MQYRSTYASYPESLAALFQHEKDNIDLFCRQTGVTCRCKLGFIIIKTAAELWALHQSALDDTILLYHKNTQDIPARPMAAIYEQYARYHIQDFYVESICYALGYVYLHELCTARKEIPFEQLPPVMQEFLTYTKRRMERPDRHMRRHKRRALLKQQKKAEKAKDAQRIEELIASLFPDSV